MVQEVEAIHRAGKEGASIQMVCAKCCIAKKGRYIFSHNEVLRWVFAFASKWMYGDEHYDHDDIHLLYM